MNLLLQNKLMQNKEVNVLSSADELTGRLTKGVCMVASSVDVLTGRRVHALHNW